MSTVATPQRQRKAVNLSIDEELLDQARALQLNVSQTLRDALSAAIRAEQRRRWREENAAAIADYNARIDRHGVFSDGLRRF